MLLVILFSPFFILGVTPQSCSTVGRYPVAGSGCKNYIHCTVVGTTMYQTNFTCPSTSVFNSRLQQCVSDSSFTCNEKICEQFGPLQPSFEVLYGDPNDATNKSYFSCVLRNGVWTTSYGACGVNECFVYYAIDSSREGCCFTNPTYCGASPVVFTCGT
nr:uncharacterized protein LOC111413308 [Onthophagus taurus]